MRAGWEAVASFLRLCFQIKDISFYVIFMIVLMSMAYTNQDKMANKQNTAVTDMFTKGFNNNGVGFDSVRAQLPLQDSTSRK